MVPQGTVVLDWSFTVRKLECLKRTVSLNRLAWNNKIGFHSRFFGLFMKARLIGTVGGIHIQ